MFSLKLIVLEEENIYTRCETDKTAHREVCNKFNRNEPQKKSERVNF